MTGLRKNNYHLVIKPVLIILFALFIAGYSFLKIKDLAGGPKIILYSPTEGASTANDLIMVKGKAERISQISMNGRKVFTNEAGNFNEPYLLANGYNLLELTASDQFGRQVVKKIQVVFNERKTEAKAGTTTEVSGLINSYNI